MDWNLKLASSLLLGALACGAPPEEPGAGEALEQVTQASVDTACEYQCTAESTCDYPCTDEKGTTELTCGEFGVCDPDADDDGVMDHSDNCQYHYNPGQQDCDADGRGDVCDPEDASYTAVSDSGICHADVDWHAYGFSIEYDVVVRYRDISACDAPDKYVKESAGDSDCVGFWSSPEACCQSNGPPPYAWSPNLGYCQLNTNACGM